ncbi:MAG: hypothetical protein K2X47_13555 [Bdellovibrionales bacterium]|nr:hypothetical protein [Bdellovibrionales bacterium]
MDRVAVLWTGGKDSALAYWRVRESGLSVVALITFVPESEVEFQAHPQSEMREQAKCLGIPLYFCKVSEPYRDSYVSQLLKLKEKLQISGVVTGDIDFVSGEPSWIVACCEDARLNVLRPLWQEARNSLLADFVRRKARARVTWINHPAIPKEWIGRSVDANFVRDMNALCAKTGIDLSGENGEYHTMTYFE